MNPEKEIDVHLAEYHALRDEINLYSQRIDRLSGFYIAALLALFGFLVRPNSEFELISYVSEASKSEGSVVIWCSIAIINSSIIIRIASLYFAILSIAQYTHFFIGRRLTGLVLGEVLYWDGPNSLSLKKSWLFMRALSQSVFMVIASSTSIGILALMKNSYCISDVTAWVYFVSLAFCAVAVFSVLFVPFAGRKFQPPLDGS